MFTFSLLLVALLLSTTQAIPSQVTGVSLSIVSWQATLRVNWNKPIVEGTFIRYDVQYRTSSQSWDTASTRQLTGENIVTVDLPNLQRGTTYKVRVRAVSNAGTGLYSAEATSTVPRFPPQVTGVRLSVVSGQAAIRVTWTNPSVEGTFLRYDVQYKISSQSWDASRTRKVTDKNTVTVDLPGLQRDTTYKVRVKAASNAGTGLYSAEATYTIPRLPSQVTGVSLSVVSGQAAIRVTWTNPSVEGTFLRYNVQYKTSSQSWDASITIKVTGKNTVTVDLLSLQRGTTYKVRVSAVSNAGTGLYSVPEAEATITLPRLPSRVTGVRLSDVSSSSVSGQAAIKVTWTKPNSDSTIIRYNVQYGPSSAHPSGWTNTVSVQGADSLTTTLTGLGRRSYDVRVLAVSDAGVGLYSATSTLSTARVPSQINSATVTKAVSSGRPALTVSWSAPQSDSSITKFEVQYRKTSDSSWLSRDVTSRSTTLTNLDAGTEYTVRVRAVSGAGNGPFGTDMRQITFTVPSQINPLIVTKAVSSGRPALRVSWSAPDSDSPIIKYELQYRMIPESRWMLRDVKSTTTTLTILDAGTQYAVRVRAVSDAGVGPFSMDMRQTTFNVPRQIAPPNLTRSVSSGPALTVGWIRPVSDLPITGYDVQYKLSSASSNAWSENIRLGVDTLSTLEHVLPRLSVDTSYDVRVRAVSAAGYGSYRLAAERTHRGPSVVSSVSFTTSEKDGSVNISLTWKVPASEVPITHYEVMYSESSMTKPTFTSRTPAATINGTANKDYLVCINAFSAVGSGGEKCTSVKPPTPPTVATTSITTTTATVNWTNEGFQYRLYLQRHGTELRSPPSPVSPPHTITGLDSNTGYTITVEAYSPLGQAGSNSTVYTLPKVSTSLNLEVVSSTVIRVAWTAPPNADRQPLIYLISYQSEFDSGMKEASTQPVELTGLHPFAEYTVRVQARNTGGQLGGNVTGKRTTLSAVPSQVTGVSLSDVSSSSESGQASINVTWTKPRSDRPIIRYHVQYGPSPAKWSNTVLVQGADTLTTTLTGLGRRSYDVRVLAVSDAGLGAYSATSTLSTARVPSQVNPPTVTKAVSSGRPALTVSWSAPQSDSSITKYELQYRKSPSGDWMSRDVTITSTTLTNLDAGTEYTVQVRAVSGIGNGPFSREKMQTTFNVNPLGGANNDSVIGDPLFTIPLQTQVNSDGFDQEPASLCFEFNGRANKQYSLISDQCTFVNAHYAPASADPTLHIISAIGIRTKATSSCLDVRVDMEGCLVTLDGRNFLGSFLASGFTLTTLRNRVRISTDNCISGRELVMWIVCDEQAEIQHLRFVVSRGAAILPTGHGLIGQFWSIPVELVPYHGPYGLFTTVPDDIQAFNLTFMPEDMPPRSVIAELAGKTWDNTKKPCLYAGNGMGGPIVEAPPEFAFGSVIEGKRDHYEVASLFEHDFQYSKFVYDC